MVNLRELPFLVLERIFAYLLDAKQCKLPPENYSDFIGKYSFHPAIMRVNKALHRETHAFFYDTNHFILVSCNLPIPDGGGILKVYSNHRAFKFDKNLLKIRDYHLRLHVRVQSVKKSSPSQFFVIPITEVPELVRILRTLEISNILRCSFKFDVKKGTSGSLSLKVQKRLLEPFKKVRGIGQRCSIIGDVDEKLAASVVKAMTPDIHWATGQAWDLYHLAKSKISIADRAFLAENLDVAHELYNDLLRFLDCANHHHPQLKGVNDENYWQSWKRLDIVCWFNVQRTRFLLGIKTGHKNWFDRVLDEKYVDITKNSYMTDEISSFNPWTQALSHFGRKDYSNAVKMIRIAYCIMPMSVPIGETLDTLVKWHTGGNKFSAQQHIKVLTRLSKLLPKVPLEATLFKEYSQEASVDEERYVLRKLGYTGDILEGFLLQIPGMHRKGDADCPGPFDRASADKQIAGMLSRVEEWRRKGKPEDLLIGAGDPGEPESMSNWGRASELGDPW